MARPTLLDSVDWMVEEDERWVILGPNGAGKTTLMQICSAQIHPTSGVAGILGEVVGTVDVFELRPRIGWTSAAVAERIPRHELVRDVVVSASYGVVGRWRERYDELDHERAHELLVEVGAGSLLDRTFGTLSEGERKRVQIARALMTDPELLILDEPAAGLDLGGREDLVATLSRLALDEYAPATILVSHHVEEIPPGFTHALMLREGRAVAAGPLPEVMTETRARRDLRDVAGAATRRTGATPRVGVPERCDRWIVSLHGLAGGAGVGGLARSRRAAGRARAGQPRPLPGDARRRRRRRRRHRLARWTVRPAGRARADVRGRPAGGHPPGRRTPSAQWS